MTTENEEHPNKSYLGDGVYIDEELDTGMLVLTTENGYGATNQIFMESEVVQNFLKYLEKRKARS